MRTCQLAAFFQSSAIRSRVFHLVMKENESVRFTIPPQLANDTEPQVVAVLVPPRRYAELIAKELPQFTG